MAANRRTFSRAITESLQFCSMSKAAQALYLHIVMNADDDGITEGRLVLRATNSRRKALQELIDNDLVAMLEPSQDIVWTVGWRSFVTVDTRYGQPSRYRRTMLEQFPDYEFADFKASVDNLPTSGTRRSQEKSSQEKSREVKSSQVKADEQTQASAYPADETELTDSFILNELTKHITYSKPHPTVEEITEYYYCSVYRSLRNGDVWKSMAQKLAQKIYDDNQNIYHWASLKNMTVPEFLEYRIQKDFNRDEILKYRNDLFDEVRQKAEKDKEEAAFKRRIDEVLQSDDAKKLIDMYYTIIGGYTPEHSRNDRDIIADLIRGYDNLSEDGLSWLRDEYEKAEKNQAEARARYEYEERINNYTLDDFATMPDFAGFKELLEEKFTLEGKLFDDEALLRNCKKAITNPRWGDFKRGIEELHRNIETIKWEREPDVLPFQ